MMAKHIENSAKAGNNKKKKEGFLIGTREKFKINSDNAKKATTRLFIMILFSIIMGILAFYLMSLAKEIYNSRNAQIKESLNVYDYFGDEDGYVTDFEKQVIDQLFLALPLEDQENLNYYLQKKNYLCDVNRARDVIEILRVRFNKVLMFQVKRVYLKVYQIKHLQNLKNTTLERKK